MPQTILASVETPPPSLFGQCPFEPGDNFGGASLRLGIVPQFQEIIYVCGAKMYFLQEVLRQTLMTENFNRQNENAAAVPGQDAEVFCSSMRRPIVKVDFWDTEIHLLKCIYILWDIERFTKIHLHLTRYWKIYRNVFTLKETLEDVNRRPRAGHRGEGCCIQLWIATVDQLVEHKHKLSKILEFRFRYRVSNAMLWGILLTLGKSEAEQ